MPKKVRSAAATTRARRKAVLTFTAKLFRDTATAIDKAESAEARYRILSERLAGQHSHLRALDRKTGARLLQVIASGAGGVAALLLEADSSGGAHRARDLHAPLTISTGFVGAH